MRQANFKQKRCSYTVLKAVLFLVFTFSFTLQTLGQVTIGSGVPPHEKALLDLKEQADGTSSGGLILPRVSLLSAIDYFGIQDHQEGTIVYNTNTSGTSVNAIDRVSLGFYYNTGNRWERLHLGSANWFYMPSIVIDVTTSGTFTRDLYLEYRKQFEDGVDGSVPADSPTAGTLLTGSPGAPNPLTSIFGADKLYYYVTGYDATVFSDISITADGKLTYTVDADNVSDATFMNIVFVEK